MTNPIRAVMALLAVLALSVAFAACGGGDDETEQPAGGGAGGGGETTEQSANLIESDPANEGKQVTVGSKNFAEQYILGEIYAQALEAAGFDVRKELDLGSEQVAYRALRRGDISGYPEYSGTALTSFYRVEIDDIPRDPQESYEQLRQTAAEEDNITALPQTPFQNTYVVTSTTETAEELNNPTTISELSEVADDMRLSGYPECRQRTDCLLGLQREYDWNPEFVSSEGQYEDLDQGQADFTMGFSTDGALALDKYVTYEDDKQLFPPYFVTFLVNEEGMEALGESGQEVIQRVQEPLTEEVMRELNSRVQIDKQEPEQVARDYLREAGFTQ